jgi:hypothetical protein
MPGFRISTSKPRAQQRSRRACRKLPSRLGVGGRIGDGVGDTFLHFLFEFRHVRNAFVVDRFPAITLRHQRNRRAASAPRQDRMKASGDDREGEYAKKGADGVRHRRSLLQAGRSAVETTGRRITARTDSAAARKTGAFAANISLSVSPREVFFDCRKCVDRVDCSRLQATRRNELTDCGQPGKPDFALMPR